MIDEQTHRNFFLFTYKKYGLNLMVGDGLSIMNILMIF